MKKKELIEAVADKAGVSNKDAKTIVNAALEVITDNLKTGVPTQIMGFGTFKAHTRPARTGRRPGTGEAMQIPARTLAKFIPSRALKSL